MGPLVRCFIAIRLPQEFGPKIQELQMNIRRKSMSDAIRWNSQVEMMLTLLALGEQQPDMVMRGATLLQQICQKYPPLELRLEGLMGVPNNTQPRYIGLNVAGDVEKLCQMREEIARLFAPIVPLSEKQYVPHVDLGRLKVESEQARTGFGRAVKMLQNEGVGGWTADTVDILQASATTAGVSYLPVASFKLGG